jgi:large subunit ribosomal protein L15
MAKELSALTYQPGSQKSRVRLGRGQGSGLGKTAGKGTKGQKARAGASKGKGFEGGQMPLRRRLPKFGFTSFNPVRYYELRLSRIAALPAGTVVDLEFLRANGIVAPSFSKLVKLIGNQDVAAALTVRLNAVSAGARGAIERAGGVVEIIG